MLTGSVSDVGRLGLLDVRLGRIRDLDDTTVELRLVVVEYGVPCVLFVLELDERDAPVGPCVPLMLAPRRAGQAAQPASSDARCAASARQPTLFLVNWHVDAQDVAEGHKRGVQYLLVHLVRELTHKQRALLPSCIRHALRA
ncbi:UDP-glucose 4-epimerase GalE [Babesia caballi]|uniref:UDP-glucose 4-epimerase GalE n=1 Tax=Babesia caballi TaxID=5871 RepID=A0AAV4M2J3_BABCB|nr:UDP-glucose 4-epimerase GalE [Babesia caballi]